MLIRGYEPRDAAVQAEIYNTAARGLPSFKPSSAAEVERRGLDTTFDPSQRFFAEEDGKAVAYCQYHVSGRVGVPWCLPRFESVREPLFGAMLRSMKSKGHASVFAAYRQDWEPIWEWLRAQGFAPKRMIKNFFLDFNEMPTPSGRLGTPITPMIPDDLEELVRLGHGVLRVEDVSALRRHFFANPSLPTQAVYVERSRADGRPLAAAAMVLKSDFADATGLDANMPCYRLGAFGTEGLSVKRVNGLFSFVAMPDSNFFSLAYDLFSHAANLLDETEVGYLAAQVPSDAPWLVSFYERHFKLHGSFPEYHRDLADVE